MENIYYFVLGVLSVLAFAGVYSMFRISAQTKKLSAEITSLNKEIEEIYQHNKRAEDSVYNTINAEVRGLADRIKEITEDVRQVDGRIDSRIDKLTNGVSEQIASMHSLFHNMEDSLYRQLKELENTVEKNAETLS
jgi:iron uptake system EfeUOB component EfeO/EfeM